MAYHIQRKELDDDVRRRDERAGRLLPRRERAGRPIPWEKPEATGLMQDGDPAQLVLQPRVAHPGASVGVIAIASGAEPRKAGKRRPAGNVADASRFAARARGRWSSRASVFPQVSLLPAMAVSSKAASAGATATKSSTKASTSATGAPAQRSQGSRKGKRAWRKNVDLDVVEEALEEARAEERVTGCVLASCDVVEYDSR
jgi:hypothetical protein